MKKNDVVTTAIIRYLLKYGKYVKRNRKEVEK